MKPLLLTGKHSGETLVLNPLHVAVIHVEDGATVVTLSEGTQLEVAEELNAAAVILTNALK